MTGRDTKPQVQHKIEGVEGAHLQQESYAYRLKTEHKTLPDDNRKD